MPKRELSKEEIEAALLANPDARVSDLKLTFHCGSSTIQRELRRHGLRTKPLSERDKPWLQGERSPLRQWHKQHPEFGEQQKGDANPVHRVRHLYRDPTYVAKITRGLRAHSASKAHLSYEEVYGIEKAAEYKDKLRRASPGRLKLFERRETSIEKWVRDVLIKLCVPFVPQAPVGNFVVDFLVPSRQLIIQTDGDYWHGNPAVYTKDFLTPRQRKRRELDRLCDRQAGALGFQILRLWEADIKSNPQHCEQIITEKIK